MKQSSRRNFLGQALTAAGTAIAAPTIINQATTAQEKRSAKVPVSGEMAVTLTMKVRRNPSPLSHASPSGCLTGTIITANYTEYLIPVSTGIPTDTTIRSRAVAGQANFNLN